MKVTKRIPRTRLDHELRELQRTMRELIGRADRQRHVVRSDIRRRLAHGVESMLALKTKACFNSGMSPEKIIDALGGTAEVARLCKVTPQAVSQWFGQERDGTQRQIPAARLMYLKAVRPDVFEAPSKEAA